MKALLLVLLLLGVPAAAQQVPNPMSKDGSNAQLPQARQAIAGEKVYYPADYGAQCNATAQAGGGADDTVALNDMFNAIRTAAQPFRVSSEGKTCRITGTLNVTNLREVGDTLPGSAGNRAPSTINLRLHCATGGFACVDALNTRFITWDHLYIYGSATSSPSIGLQFGRNGSLANADMNVFNQPYITGTFTKAAVYNYAGEQTTTISASIHNAATAAGTYAWMEDGCNSISLGSSFTTPPPANNCQSATFNTYIGGWFMANVPLFLSGTSGTKFISSYGVVTGSECGIRIYANGTGFNSTPRGLELDFSFEPSPPWQYCLSSSTASMRFWWLKVTGFIVQSPTGIFKTDPGITAVNVSGLDIRLGQVPPGAVLFSAPSVWNITGLDAVVPGDMLYNGHITNLSGRYCRIDEVDLTYNNCTYMARGTGKLQFDTKGASVDAAQNRPISIMNSQEFGCISWTDATCSATDNYILSGRPDNPTTSYNTPIGAFHQFRVGGANIAEITTNGVELPVNGPLLKYQQPIPLGTLVADYPCNAGNKGSVTMINDALTPAWHAPAVGGGATQSMVMCNGANWIIF